MSERIRRRVDVLEKEERSRRLQQQSSLATTSFFCLKVVLAHYLGGLEPDDDDPGEAAARSLGYESRDDYLEALFKGQKSEINKRFKNAARRLFAQAGPDFDRSPPSALSESFARLLDELPPQWMNWLASNLQEECRRTPIGTGSNMPLKFFLPVAGDRPAACSRRLKEMTQLSRKSRVLTQIKGLFSVGPEDLLREESRAYFWAFRRYIRPTMKLGWWQREIASELQYSIGA